MTKPVRYHRSKLKIDGVLNTGRIVDILKNEYWKVKKVDEKEIEVIRKDAGR